MKEFAVYTLARFGLFVATYAVIVGGYLLITGGSAVPVYWPFLAAIVLSSIASVFLLKGPRARFAARVEERARRASRRFEEARAKEDVDEEPAHELHRE